MALPMCLKGSRPQQMRLMHPTKITENNRPTPLPLTSRDLAMTRRQLILSCLPPAGYLTTTCFSSAWCGQALLTGRLLCNSSWPHYVMLCNSWLRTGGFVCQRFLSESDKQLECQSLSGFMYSWCDTQRSVSAQESSAVVTWQPLSWRVLSSLKRLLFLFSFDVSSCQCGACITYRLPRDSDPWKARSSKTTSNPRIPSGR